MLFADGSLCGSQTCNRHAERAAGHVGQADVVAELDGRRIAALLAADAELDVRAGLTAQLARHLDQTAHAGLIELGERIGLVDLAVIVGREELARVVAAEAEGHLRQVVRAEGEERGLLGDLVGGQGRARDLDHRADLVFHVGAGFLDDLLRGLVNDGLDIGQLLRLANQRNHDLGHDLPGRAAAAGSQRGPDLCIQGLCPSADAEAPGGGQEESGPHREDADPGGDQRRCVLDTGIFPHIDFTGRILAFQDFIGHRIRPYDDNSHGTHVCGIIGGDGRASEGRIRGIAPGCSLIVLKVLDRTGNGRKEDVLQAFRWILENKRYYGIRVVNISVGTTCRRAEDHRVLIAGVEQLWDAGLVVVAAAGNQGPKAGSVTAPGSSRKIITVGSSDLLTGRTAISGRGPTFECVCKPDLVAPGNHVLACAPGADNGYGVKSGTSMSTPLVAGAAALMLEKNPELTNVQIKMKLKESARDMGLPKNQQGWGELDLERFMEL